MSKKTNDNNKDVILDRLIQNKKVLSNIFIVSIIIGIVIIIWLLIVLYQAGYKITHVNLDLIKTGSVGDFIGGVVGSIWALVGVVLFYGALVLQRISLEKQIEEMTQTKEVLEKQSFESTFYELLNQHRSLLSNIKYDYKDHQDGDKRKLREGTQFMSESFYEFEISYYISLPNLGIAEVLRCKIQTYVAYGTKLSVYKPFF
ncbi:MAG: hypothetical protein PVH88_26460 [Ignavibacteria bacterium]|jgi:hypothetical protein